MPVVASVGSPAVAIARCGRIHRDDRLRPRCRSIARLLHPLALIRLGRSVPALGRSPFDGRVGPLASQAKSSGLRMVGRRWCRVTFALVPPAAPLLPPPPALLSLGLPRAEPHRVSVLRPDGSVQVLAEDPDGAVLNQPANIVFVGEGLGEIVVSSLGGWSLMKADVGLTGVPLRYPKLAR